MERDFGLGRIAAPDDDHLRKYPVRALAKLPANVPVVFGFDWHESFFEPVRDRDGSWWIGRGPESGWGKSVGGHAICGMPEGEIDLLAWWRHYDQQATPHCVGFSVSRACSLATRRQKFDGHRLYADAHRIAEKMDNLPPHAAGTTVRSGLEAARTTGPYPVVGKRSTGPDARYGIAEYRWTEDADDLVTILGATGGYVTLLQSYGTSAPHQMRMPLDAVRILLARNGDCGIVIDRPGPE